MKAMKLVSLAASLALVMTACGDDDTGTTIGSTESVATTGAGSTTGAPTTMPATTAVTTTTAAPTTTQAADAHPIFGLSWATVWPADGATAVYRVTKWSGQEEDVPAVIEYGVDFRGETYDRLTIGTPEPDNAAMVVYFDRSEPWKVAIKAVVTYGESFLDGPVIVEVFDVPTVFDGSLPEGESATSETEINLEFPNGSDTMPALYDLALVSLDETVDVPLGTVTGTALMEGSVSGEEFTGPEPFMAELWLHPQHLIVRMTGAPAFDIIEIVETWG